jgi:hypothetical protein
MSDATFLEIITGGNILPNFGAQLLRVQFSCGGLIIEVWLDRR